MQHLSSLHFTRLVILLLFCISMLVCNAQSKQKLQVTFKNNSGEDFKNLKVYIGNNLFYFFNLKKGESTNSVTVKYSYSYCYAKVITAKDTVICQPQDFTGEQLYTQGSLVIALNIQPGYNGTRYLHCNGQLIDSPKKYMYSSWHN
ncbi:hypothetical protein [Ferruginibacter sp.]|nr:hypothetical protein [Ferruginibacter sp.]